MAISVGSVIAMIPAAKADGHAPNTNTRSDERRGGASADKNSKRASVGTQIITLYRIDSPTTTTHRLDEKSARDAVVAYALRGDLATMTREEVLAELVSVDEDGFLSVVDVCPITA